ncbi:MAG TPA: DEAD/DEAH box helicase, partial [Ignavibacteriaceae bacterium]|nr:DEAD/DEAH box helicase [Ignavibacteriaceae bacterium]
KSTHIIEQYELNASLDDIPEVLSALVEEYFATGKPNRKKKSVNLPTPGNSDAIEETIVIHSNLHSTIVKEYGFERAYQKLGVEGHRYGNYIKTHCPVHDDENPSFAIYYDTGLAYCHTARATYNVPGLAKAIYGDQYKEKLKEIFNIDISKPEFDENVYTQKSMSENLGVRGDVVFYDKYISDAVIDGKNFIEDMLTDPFNHTAVSKTGSGKTTAMIDSANKLGLKLVIVTPTIPLTEQLANKYKKYNAKLVTGNTPSDKIRNIHSRWTKLICITYDSLHKLFDNPNFNASEYILVIDEVHNLITAQGYRAKALDQLVELSAFFPKTISLTGTPEGVILPNGNKVIKFQKRIPDPTLKVKLYEYMIEGTGIEHLTLHLIKNYKGGIVVIYIDNTETLQILQEYLMSRGKFREDEIACVTANTKEEEAYQSIILDSVLKSGIKVLLCTQVISEGVNINNYDVRAVYTLNSRNTIAVRQMVARFRKVSKSDMVLNEFFLSNNNTPMIDFQDSFEVGISNAEFLLNNEKRYRQKHNLVFNPVRPRFYTSMFKETLDNNFYYYDNRIQDYVINKYKIAADVHNQIQSILANNLNLRAEYYGTFEGWDVTFEFIMGEMVNMNEIKILVEERDEKRYQAVTKLLEDRTQETVTAYCQYRDQKFGIDNQSQISDLLLTADMKQFYEENKKLLNSKKGKEAVESYVRFHKAKLPHETIIQVINKPGMYRNSFHEELLAYFTMQALTKNPQVFAYDKNDGVSIKRAAIIKWIIDNILPLEDFDPKEHVDNYNDMLISIGCNPETQRHMVINIGQLLNIKRDKIKRNGKTINFYDVITLHTPESILTEVGLVVTEVNVAAIKAAADVWFQKKLTALENSAVKSGNQLPPSISSLKTPKGVTKRTASLYNITPEVTPPAEKKAKDEFPFPMKKSA